ncbi:MAG: class I SAM-dependent methyltransferase [Verrucomicrobiota bacterium]
MEESTGRAAQIPDPEVAKALDAAYTCGSEIPGMMEGTGIGRQYADDYLKTLTDIIGRPFTGLRVLEIGCGTGYLLQRLQQEGADVLGIEPGCQSGQEDSGVRIVRGFFPSVEVKGEFDLIIMHSVLEHLPDPTDFLRTVLRQLTPEGILCLAVPDESGFLQRGDVSMLFTEHYSYFSPDSLYRTIAKAGGGDIRVKCSTFSALLYASCTRAAAGDDEIRSPGMEADLRLVTEYRRKVNEFTEKFQYYLEAVRTGGLELGIYAAGRAVNALVMSGVSMARLRFFDDAEMMHGTYFPSISVAVEDREDFIKNPPDEVLIMSVSFGARIEAALRPLVPARVRFQQLEELCK